MNIIKKMIVIKKKKIKKMNKNFHNKQINNVI